MDPRWLGGLSRTFPIPAATACNIPAGVQAYPLNLAWVPKGALGYLTVWPTGQSKPLAASLNASTNTVTANAAIVPAGNNGSVDVFASAATDLVIDMNGYFAPPASGGLSLYNVAPCRVLDTREPAGAPAVDGVLDIQVATPTCGIPTAAPAYVVSVTVVPVGILGYLTLWPRGTTQPFVASLNAADGAITSNMAIVPATNGWISAFFTSPSHLVVDITGYFGQ